MELKFKLSGNRKMVANSDLLTVRLRKEIKLRTKIEVAVIEEDPAILADLEKKFKETPPTQKDIYQGYLRLVKPEKPSDDQEFFEEICRVCCKWVNDKGKVGETLSIEEYQELPFNIANYIAGNLFTDDEQSFLETTPAKS